MTVTGVTRLICADGVCNRESMQKNPTYQHQLRTQRTLQVVEVAMNIQHISGGQKCMPAGKLLMVLMVAGRPEPVSSASWPAQSHP